MISLLAGPIDGTKDVFVEASFKSGQFKIRSDAHGHSVIPADGIPISLTNKKLFVLFEVEDMFE